MQIFKILFHYPIFPVDLPAGETKTVKDHIFVNAENAHVAKTCANIDLRKKFIDYTITQVQDQSYWQAIEKAKFNRHVVRAKKKELARKRKGLATVIVFAFALVLVSCVKQNPDPCGCQAAYKTTQDAKAFAACQTNCH